MEIESPFLETKMNKPDDKTLHDADFEPSLATTRPLRFAQRKRDFSIAPDFKERLRTYQEVDAGETVSLECLLSGFPVPEVTWYKEDQVLTNEFPYKIEHDGGRHKLTISTVWKQDEGAYKCKAENKEGSSSTLGYISVKGEARSRSRSPSPRRHRNNPRAVSLSPMVSTITENISDEEREEQEYSRLPPSPVLSSLEQLRKEYKKARKHASLLSKSNKKSQHKGHLENDKLIQNDSSLLDKHGRQVVQDAVAKSEKQRDDARYQAIRDSIVKKTKKGVPNGDSGTNDISFIEDKKLKVLPDIEPDSKPTADTRQSRKRRKPRPFEVDTSRSRSVEIWWLTNRRTRPPLRPVRR
ncbi:titin isoform X2 [Lingula anatina]|uniref:Titin isoform X2 n=1 Tax=Lingula anatina TaxID=7574 RepID=A0A1S3I3H0_LINAN|nr:titin isoform X2 [Lingula anatina]|eukprot:XP_013391894.1 titin isoform X2 [Lingula anatina]